ncbi:MAG: hypothetical protein FJZ58_07860, partial [Chlamydiae bacterium]|nr:hypothetical protein [Chlamydiota bacterium]
MRKLHIFSRLTTLGIFLPASLTAQLLLSVIEEEGSSTEAGTLSWAITTANTVVGATIDFIVDAITDVSLPSLSEISVNMDGSEVNIQPILTLEGTTLYVYNDALGPISNVHGVIYVYGATGPISNSGTVFLCGGTTGTITGNAAVMSGCSISNSTIDGDYLADSGASLSVSMEPGAISHL